ncbi:MAG: XrtA/PEP-CTERM system histidine kinase PrsK [Verrucomicrobiia bacterium]|jgi:putative PEP-CTERM system histidine kinase
MNVTFALAISAAILAATLALGVAIRAQRSLVRWTFVLGMLALSAERVFLGMSVNAVLPGEVVHWERLRMIALSLLPGVWILFSLSYSRGNAREFLAKWWFVVAAAFLLPAGLAVLFGENLIALSAPGAVEDHRMLRLGLSGIALNLLVLIAAVFVLMNLERTFRASVGTMRWRIKFMILGLGVLFAVQVYTSSQALLFRATDLSLEGLNSGALLVACLLIVRSLLRAGQFDVTVYPSLSVLHNSLTVLLAGIYLFIVGAFAKVVTFLGGDATFTLKAFVILVALVLLAVLLLSERVRLLTKRFVSRHLQRPLHDYRLVWRKFTEGTASRVDQTELCRATVKLIAEIFQALSVTIWLMDDTRERLTFGASTSLSDTTRTNLSSRETEVAEVVRGLLEQTAPVDIDTSKERWATLVRQWHPDEFRTGGNRIAVPMISNGELLGLITLGDRVGGVPFSQQDFDLLKCLGNQAAASVRNVQMSQKLLQARELEAFQMMSVFFIHDLKNTASTLNLMLRNLPIHFDKPAFREDALRGISKTVDHINQLIERLSLLRHDLEVQPTESDLNELVSQAVTGWAKTSDVDLVQDLHPLPRLYLDREQVLKVVTNLVLNATQAVSGKGRVCIETTHRNGWVVLAVTDNGCGMSAEFRNRSLFRPFQTTKKTGLGIGVFQSKIIVEAHGGRIEVESELGKGTTFRVLLPVQKLGE